MPDPADAEGRVWAQRLLAFYRRSVPLSAEDGEVLAERLAEGVARSVRAGHPVRRWPEAANGVFDSWEAGTGRTGPRVAHFDLARGVITKAD